MSDLNGHEWRIGRFQADDESECSLCGLQGDDPEADEPCPHRAALAHQTAEERDNG
jgi:hypothetical protein